MALHHPLGLQIGIQSLHSLIGLLIIELSHNDAPAQDGKQSLLLQAKQKLEHAAELLETALETDRRGT